MFKIKRNYKLHRFSVLTIFRQCKRYNPCTLRYALATNKCTAIEAKYQPHEI